MIDQTIEQIEINQAAAKEAIALRDALSRLEKSSDFQKVIEKRYMTDEPVRLVKLKAAPSMQDPEQQTSILKQMDAIGGLLTFFFTIKHQADMAEKALEESDAMLDELREEAVANG